MEAAGLVSDVAIPRARAWPRLDLKWVAIAGAVALVAWLALVPLVFLLWQSFLTPETASAPAQLTLENYRAAYSTAETLHLFANSLAFACGAALLSFVLGATFAFINERTDTPCKSLFFGLAVIPLVIPSVLFTVAWILLASPKIGLINLALQGWLGTDAVFVNVYSLGGMIFVDGLHYSPMAFLLMTAALRAMDPALEESALMSGASALQVARRITLGLVWPAVVASLLILFVRAIESFEVPALLGLPVGIEVYTSAIYQAVHKYPSEVGLACAYAVTLLLIAALCISMQSRLSSRAEHFATVTGKGFRPRALAIGRWRYLTASLFVLYFAVIVLLPFLVLVWSSLQKFYRVPSLAALGTVSLDAYRSVLDFPSVGTAVWNSILLSFGAATIIRRIVLPLLKPGLIAGWIYVVIVSVRELSSSILLYSPGTEVVSIVIWELWQNGQYVELSALGVMLIAALFVLVMAAQVAGRRFGIVEAWREIRKEQGMARNAVV